MLGYLSRGCVPAHTGVAEAHRAGEPQRWASQRRTARVTAEYQRQHHLPGTPGRPGPLWNGSGARHQHPASGAAASSAARDRGRTTGAFLRMRMGRRWCGPTPRRAAAWPPARAGSKRKKSGPLLPGAPSGPCCRPPPVQRRAQRAGGATARTGRPGPAELPGLAGRPAQVQRRAKQALPPA